MSSLLSYVQPTKTSNNVRGATYYCASLCHDTLYSPMQNPKQAANKTNSGNVVQNMLRMHTAPAPSTAMLCTRSVFTHLKSASQPAPTRPTVFVIPTTQEEARSDT